MTLELRDIFVSFGTREVLAGVSCIFESREITGLIGNNGAGKTTLLRAATTMLPPLRGDVLLDGQTLSHTDVDRRTHIGALIEKPGHYDELTVSENLAFFYSFHCADPRVCQREVSRSLERFDLDVVRNEKVGQLSTGYRQRLAVARAFHPNTQVVLLDEPISGLDPTTRSHLKDTMRSLTKESGVALCLSSHGLGDLGALCDRLYVLAGGRLFEFASFDQIRSLVNAPTSMDLDAVYVQLIAELTGR